MFTYSPYLEALKALDETVRFGLHGQVHVAIVSSGSTTFGFGYTSRAPSRSCGDRKTSVIMTNLKIVATDKA